MQEIIRREETIRGKKEQVRRKPNGNRYKRIHHIPYLEGAACGRWLDRRQHTANSYEEEQIVFRGEVWYADLGAHPATSIQEGCRPVLVVSNNANNSNARTLTVIPLTARLKKLSLVTHVLVKPTKACPLEYDSMALTEQITIIDKFMLREKIGRLDCRIMQQVDRALCVQLGLRMPDSPKGGGAA